MNHFAQRGLRRAILRAKKRQVFKSFAQKSHFLAFESGRSSLVYGEKWAIFGPEKHGFFAGSVGIGSTGESGGLHDAFWSLTLPLDF